MRSWVQVHSRDLHGEDRAVAAPIRCMRIPAGRPAEAPATCVRASVRALFEVEPMSPPGTSRVTPGLQQRLEPLIAIDPGMPMQRHGHLPDARRTHGRCQAAST